MSHMWPCLLSSPWSQVFMAFSLQNASPLLRIMGWKCPVTYQATLEKRHHKDFKCNNSVVLLSFNSERKPVLGDHGAGSPAPRGQGEMDADHTRSSPEATSTRQNS